VLRQLLDSQPWRAAVRWPDGFAGGISHRLDNSTSGALWLADDLTELTLMRAAFSGGELTKIYLMVAGKDVPWHSNECDRAIAHDRRRKRRMIVQRGKSTPHRGKWYPANTRFERLKGRVWRVCITTGVTHQIRVHAAFLGIPLAGDAIYGGGPAHAAATASAPFLLHHEGLRGPGDLMTQPVAPPQWISDLS
jgi:23S rRNA pseudouridine1911/1915/1917 synthase